MKTLKQRVNEALKNFSFEKEVADINALIAYAYYLGKCKGVKEVCDEAREIFEKQIEIAEKMHFHNLAMKVQGNIKTIYHSDYCQWIEDFSQDETEL